MPNPPSTTTTFIQKLRANDAEGWERFREHYIPVIYAFAKGSTHSKADALTVTDIVVEKIAKGMPTFERKSGKKFRNFVKTICYRQVNDFHRQRDRHAKKIDPAIFDKRFTELELRRAIAIAKQRSKRTEANWELFHMRFEQKRTIAEIAAEKGLKPGTVQRTIRRAVVDVQKVLGCR